MADPVLPDWLPKNEKEMEEYFSQLRQYGEWRLKNIQKEIVELNEAGIQKVETAELQEKKTIEEVKAAEAEHQAMKRELEKLHVAGLSQQAERQKQMLAELESKQEKLATAQKMVEHLQNTLKQHEEDLNQQRAKCDKKVHALKTVYTLYSEKLLLKMKIDETKVVTLKLQLPQENGTTGEFSFQLRETVKGVFKSVNPQPQIQAFADELDKSGNVTKFMCDVRNYAVSVQQKFKKQKMSH